jgi:predicted ribonuclease YlaK
LDTNGVISGTPVNSGTNRFIVRVTDAASATANQLLTLVVNASTNQQVIVLNQATQLANGQFQFTFNTASGVSYIIQYSTNLTDWTSVSILSGFGGPLTVSDLTATDKQRFYRVKAGP